MRRRPRTVVGRWLLALALTLAALSTNILSAPTPAVNAQPLPTLTCVTSTAWLAQNNGLAPPTTLYQEQFGAGSVAFAPVGSAPYRYNALGYNPLNGYLYAIDSNTLHVLRVDPATGAVTDLGLTIPPLVGLQNQGAFDAAGNYYVVGASLDLNVINVTTLTMTVRTMSQPSGVGDFTFGPGGYLWGGTGATGTPTNVI